MIYVNLGELCKKRNYAKESKMNVLGRKVSTRKDMEGILSVFFQL